LGEVNTHEFSVVFGADSQGDTAEQRARTSSRRFVRGQVQLGEDRPAATGVRLHAAWALHLFGYDKLKQAAYSGAARVSDSSEEPASTIIDRRNALGLSHRDLAQASGLTEAEVRNAETPGTITEIRKLQRLAQVLGLDDENLAIVRGAGADGDLAVRLRTLRNGTGVARLSARLVTKLAEAAWTITRQTEIAELLAITPEKPVAVQQSDDFGYPIWQRGYELAEMARDALGISECDSILSVRSLIDAIGIPLVQAEMGARFAGATLESGDVRGIVVNIEGDNENPWVRRMTLCHELGHFLFDPPARLNHLHVDSYDDISGASNDPVETRANAFAIAFLAPKEGVRAIIEGVDGTAEQLATLMTRYGIAATAARYHLANIHRLVGYGELDTAAVPGGLLPQPDDEWLTRENWTADYFPISDVPVGRRGRFAGLVVKAMKQNLISADTAALWLASKPSQVESRVEDVLQVTGMNE
jgi:transcriptional regulator with XRE-family HTH domain